MEGHKTNGGWDDVTSIGRNDIVFEGRNKEYGAYYIRKRYDFTLLLGLLITLSIGVVCAGIPLVMNMLNKNAAITDTKENNRDKIHKVIIPIVDPPPVKHQQQHIQPSPPPPSNNHTQNTPPEIVKGPDTTKDKPHTPITIEPVHSTAPEGQGPENPVPPAGPGTGTGPDVVQAPPSPVSPTAVDVMPKFPGDLSSYISDHVVYPELYTETGVEGVVYATFVVEPDGSVSDVKILRGVAGGPKLSDETIRVIQNMPKWAPGMIRGQAVRVQYMLPVHFQISPAR